jgi:death-on-curing protein
MAGHEPASDEQRFVYLSVDDVAQIIEAVSDAPMQDSVRDLGLLIGAVERPAMRYRGRDVYWPLAVKAAALMESIARDNPLFDGNKRLAWLATNVFLELNGAGVQFSDNETFSLLREVAQGHISTQELSQRLQSRLTPWPPR